MGCFLVPTAEAIIVTAAYFVVKSQEKKKEKNLLPDRENIINDEPAIEKWSKKLLSLDYLLLGGSALLAFEHLWHGEISPIFPFLTAASEGPAAISEMLYEMGTVGVAMAATCTAVWGVILLIKRFLKKPSKNKDVSKAK